MIRGIIGLTLTLVLAAVVYFAFIEPNVDDVKDKVDDPAGDINLPEGDAKEVESKGKRLARCLRDAGTDTGALERCRDRYLK